MPYKIEAACPCFGKTAYGIEEIERLFGWRKPDNKQIPQSYCRECRSAKCRAGEPCKARKD